MTSKYRYRFTPLALQDIDSALTYISETLCNGKAALDLLDKIERAIATVCEFPYSSADCSLFLVTDDRVRHVLVENYVLIYEIAEEEKSVNVLRFRYTRMAPSDIMA